MAELPAGSGTFTLQRAIELVLATGTGPTGPQGPKGDTGATGANGTQGATGTQGAAGAAGATGPQGPKGDTGNTGPQGPAGSGGGSGDTLLVAVAGTYPARPSVGTAPAGTARYIGPEQPTDWLTYDLWLRTPS